MARRGQVAAAALAFSLWVHVQGVDGAACAAGDGRCRWDAASDSPVSLLQTYMSDKATKGGMEQVSQELETLKMHVDKKAAQMQEAQQKWQEALEKVNVAKAATEAAEKEEAAPKVAWRLLPHRAGLVAMDKPGVETEPPKTGGEKLGFPLGAAALCFIGATMAGFVQAILAVYSALTFHFVCTMTSYCFAPSFFVGVNHATLYIMCFCPVMDMMQVYHYRNEKRNWSFLISYGICIFAGLFAGLAVLCYAMNKSVVIGLQGFLIFSCAMVLLNEGVMRIKRWRAEAQEQAQKEAMEQKLLQAGSSPSGPDGPGDQHHGRPKHDLIKKKMMMMKNADLAPEETTEVTECTETADTCRVVSDLADESSTISDTDISTTVPSSAAAMAKSSEEETQEEPPEVDLSKTSAKVTVVVCGLLAGFSLGAISIGGTFVLLMLNLLEMRPDEWRVNQCYAEAPLHLARMIIVMSCGLVHWGHEWMSLLACWIGICLGLCIGNQCNHLVSPAYLRQAVLIGIASTIVILGMSIVNEVTTGK